MVDPDSRDTNFKTGFVIFFYSSVDQSKGTVEELSQQGKDWASLEEAQAGIWTAATHGISVNTKHLKKTDNKGHVTHGHLHTGDIVQVYHHTKFSERLKVRYKFYLGAGNDPRPAGQSFTTIAWCARFQYQ
jgi:hypothetical protein